LKVFSILRNEKGWQPDKKTESKWSKNLQWRYAIKLN
jgi:hypothetical protein